MKISTKLTLLLLVAMAASLSFSSCKKPLSKLEKFDRATLLKNEADLVIVPAYQNFSNAAKNMVEAIDSFCASPSTMSLSNLRSALSQNTNNYMLVEIFNIGYANANTISAQIATFPVNFTVIENEISSSQTIDESYIAATGTTRKGLSAVEYLIYGEGISDAQLLAKFTTDIAAPQRKKYLQSVGLHIQTVAKNTYNSWNKGASYVTFTSQTQLDISGSVNLLVNALTEHIEAVRKAKVGKPAGIDNNGNVNAALIENRLSARSLENIQQNIRSWQLLMNANGGVGLSAYLDQVDATYNGQNLSTVINEQLVVCSTKAAAITIPLDQAISAQPTAVAELHLALKKLTVLTKVDMASNLGVVITFSDNDGD